MNKFFPTTYMMLDARHCPKRRGLIFELFVFYFAYWVIKMIEGLVAAIPQTLYFMQDPSFLALMEPDRLETLTRDTKKSIEREMEILAGKQNEQLTSHLTRWENRQKLLWWMQVMFAAVPLLLVWLLAA